MNKKLDKAISMMSAFAGTVSFYYGLFMIHEGLFWSAIGVSLLIIALA